MSGRLHPLLLQKPRVKTESGVRNVQILDDAVISKLQISLLLPAHFAILTPRITPRNLANYISLQRKIYRSEYLSEKFSLPRPGCCGVSMCARWLDLEGLSLLKNCSLFRFSSAFKRVIENDWGKLQIDAFCCWSAVSWGILGLEGRKGYLADKYTFITLMLWLGLNERVILTSRLVKVVKPMQCNTLIVCIKAVFSVSFRSIHDLHNRVVREFYFNNASAGAGLCALVATQVTLTMIVNSVHK